MEQVNLGGMDLADAKIKSIATKEGELIIEIEDYQENRFLVEFQDTVAFEAMSPVNEDLSHFIEQSESELLKSTRSNLKDLEPNLTTFEFFSAWDSRKVLSVVASGYTTEISNKS